MCSCDSPFKKKKKKRVCSKQFLIWKKKAFPPVIFKRQFPTLRDHDNTYAVWYTIIQRKRGRTKLFCFIVTKYLRVSLSTWQLKVNLLLVMDSCRFDDRNPLLWVAQHFSSLMLGFRWSCKSFWIFICVIVLVQFCTKWRSLETKKVFLNVSEGSCCWNAENFYCNVISVLHVGNGV